MTPDQKEEFRQAVYELTRMVPPGRITTYGLLARAAGWPAHARMVGKFMSACGENEAGTSVHPKREYRHIPAHRVVASGGMLSAREAFGEPGTVERLLGEEGIVVERNRVKDWRRLLWDPLREIASC